MKTFFLNLLAFLSRKIINKYHPLVIAITGSVGKTSAKEAVFNVVSQKYKSRRSEKNYNNEFGLPLTIIGEDSPGKNPLNWLKVFFKALGLMIIKQKYPQALVLEMGVDRVGDMDHLVSITHPKVAVITNIGLSHYEFFKDIAATAAEKGKLAECLRSDDFLAINADNPTSLEQKKKSKGKIYCYGLSYEADIRIFDIKENLDNKYFTSFTVKTPTKIFEAQIKALGQTHLSAVAAAIAVAEALQIEKDLIIKGLSEYRPAPGRLNIISGIKHSVIIDDTYNASPDSTKTALSLLSKLPGPYKIAVLGDMLELGAISDQSHLEIGQIAANLRLNRLITVGPGGKIIAQGAKNAGMSPDCILSFDSSEQAKMAVQEMMPPESLVLIKGSQGVRMEKITKEIMGEPMRAKELLCRQYGKWLK